MKVSKRFLSMLLVVVFCLTSFAIAPVSAAFTDLTEEHYAYEAVNVLSKLGIINGYEENGSFNFKPDNNVTRAEFTAMLLRTRGMGTVGSTSLENPPFPDVTTPDVSWAIGNIRTARELKIINGYDDGTFKPNNNVSYEEAVKMIVCALGYGEMGSDGAFWYSRYLMSATTLGFLEGAGGAISTPATRATIATMLYNCLEIQLAENNEITTKTILENDLKLTKKVGFIASNPTISLAAPDSTLRDNEVQITTPDKNGNPETLTYKVDDASKYSDMLGAQITFYYTTNLNSGFKNLVLATVKNSSTIEIDADLIERANGSSIEYYRNEDANNTTVANIANDSIVVYNDRLYESNADDSSFADYVGTQSNPIPTIGSIKLLDRDGDSVYDVVFVNDYKAYFVSAVTSSDYTITDNLLRGGVTDGSNKIVLNPKDSDVNLTFVDANGKASSFSSIKKNSVVCVKESNYAANGGRRTVTAIVCNDTASGTISGVSSNGNITINGKPYKFSPQAPWENYIGAATPLTKPVKGESGTFYMDCNGNIIAYDKTVVTGNQQYGYIMSVNYDNSEFDEVLELYIMTLAGSKDVYKVSTTTKLDGADNWSTLADFRDALDDTAKPSANYPSSSNDTYSQLVKFSTRVRKGETVIDEIITAQATSSGETITTDALYFYDGITAASADVCNFEINSKQFKLKSNSSKKVYVGGATLLKVPENKGAVNQYKKMSLGDLREGVDYRVEFYDISSSNSAKVVLVYGGAAAVGGVKASSPVMLITEKEDAERTILRGYIDGDIQEKALSLEDANTQAIASSLKIGDVVRLGEDNEGYATVKAADIIFSSTDASRRGSTYPVTDTNNNGVVAFKIVWGSLYFVDSDRVVLCTDLLGAGESVTTEFTTERSWYNNAKFYQIDTSKSIDSKDYIVDVTVDKDSILESLQQYDGVAKPAEIFIHMPNEYSVKTVIIKQ